MYSLENEAEQVYEQSLDLDYLKGRFFKMLPELDKDVHLCIFGPPLGSGTIIISSEDNRAILNHALKFIKLDEIAEHTGKSPRTIEGYRAGRPMPYLVKRALIELIDAEIYKG